MDGWKRIKRRLVGPVVALLVVAIALNASLACKPSSLKLETGSQGTVIVAATNSRDKSLADFTCDGTADQEEINSAINSLSEQGGVVQLLKGNYTVNSSIVMQANIWLRGTGNVTVISLADSSNCHVIDSEMTKKKPNIWISDLVVDGNKGKQTGWSCGIYIGSNELHAGLTGGFDGKAHVLNCQVRNCRNSGIEIGGYNYSIVKDCWIDNCGYGYGAPNNCAIELWAYGASVTSNCVTRCTWGIALLSKSNMSASGNTIRDCTFDGILVSQAGDNINVGENTIENCRYAIQVANQEVGQNYRIAGNTCVRNRWGGIAMQNLVSGVISGNTCKSNGADHHVTAQDFYNYAPGLATRTDGISSGNVSDCVFAENICQDNAGNGLSFAARCNRNLIMCNHCTDTRQAGLKTQLYGINLSMDSEANVLSGNYLEGNKRGALQTNR